MERFRNRDGCSVRVTGGDWLLVSNLQLRVITSIFLVTLTLVASWMGGYVFTTFSLIAGAALYYEWQGLTHMYQTKIGRVVGWCFYGVVVFLLVRNASAFVIFASIFVGCAILSLLSGQRTGWVAGGFIYATAAPVSLILIRGDDFLGFAMLVFLYAVVWSTDSAAYFSGKTIGGAKMVPKISPNKTWSGAIGGAVFAVAFSMATLFFLFENVSFSSLMMSFSGFIMIVLALILSIASQAGDIGESWIKRRFDVKDSSNLLPGHGGFMDRLDGLVAASIVFYIVAAVLGHVDQPFLFFKFL